MAQVIGRKPIRNLQDNLFYMTEYTPDMVYRVHAEDGIFIGAETSEECLDKFADYIVNSLIRDNSVIKLTNFDPEFMPECFLSPGSQAQYIINVLNIYLLVNNYDDKSAIKKWLLDSGTIVF